jgi:aspartate/methionine/tyrosine aminotransferase
VDDNAYADGLLNEAAITVTPGTFFGPSGHGHIRISLSTPTERVREAMARWLAWAAKH